MFQSFRSAVTKEVGKNVSPRFISTSILFTIILCFYVITLGSFVDPMIYPFIDRVTYATPFADKYFIDKYVDSLIIILGTSVWLFLSIKKVLKVPLFFLFLIIALIGLSNKELIVTNVSALLSLPLIIFLLILNHFLSSKILYFNKNLTITYISIAMLILTSVSIFILYVDLANLELDLPSINYLYYIFLLLSTVSPILMVLISLSFPIKVFLIYILKRNQNNDYKKRKDFLSKTSKSSKVKNKIIWLFIIILLSIIISTIPQFYLGENEIYSIGADSIDYTNILNTMKNSEGISELLRLAFVTQSSGDRGLSLIVFYFFTHVWFFGLTISIDYISIILSPLLVISIYLFTLRLTFDERIALVASLLTPISFHILIGIYGGFFANWFSLIFVYFALAFLIRALKLNKKFDFFLFSLFFSIVILTHAPTWAILFVVTLIFLFSLLFLKYFSTKKIIFAFIMIIPSIIIEITRLILVRSSGILQDLTFAESQGSGLQDLTLIWNNLIDTTHLYLGGQFGNPIILLLVLYWLYICNIKNLSSILMIMFFSLSAFTIFFSNQIIQTRFLYEIPFQIPAAISLVSIYKKYGIISFLSILMVLIIISIRTISNFYFNPI